MVKILDLDKKMKIKGLSAVRADVFPNALAFVKAFFAYMNFETVNISNCGLREGYMFNYTIPLTLEKPISDILGYSLNANAKQLGLNTANSDQVFNLCVQLFRQLRVLHKFPRQYVRVLRLAAMMHQSGKRFEFYNYQKHSSYYILNAPFYGIAHKDIVLAAYATDMYNKDDANVADWAKYREFLGDDELEAGKKLAVILRLAVGLNFSMNNVVKEINCDVLGDSVIMKTETEGAESSLEIKAALTAAGEFKRVFKKNLEIL
jgi:exopolyphosphatase/guanosine-5'-triphosphate,3'-diphosphate pyrophosphatase